MEEFSLTRSSVRAVGVNNLTRHGFTVSDIICCVDRGLRVLSANIEASKRWRAGWQTCTSLHDAFYSHESAVSLVLLGQTGLTAGLVNIKHFCRVLLNSLNYCNFESRNVEWSWFSQETRSGGAVFVLLLPL